MAKTYVTRDGDMLDDICWQHYGNEAVVQQVLEANPGIADMGAVLPSGVRLVLPDVVLAKTENVVSLWS